MAMKKYSGFTLIELMVTIAVAGVLIAVGLPQMSIFFKGSNMVAVPIDFRQDILFARSKAITLGNRVSICKSANAGAATPACAVDATGWENGWFVFVEGQNVGNEIGVYTADDGAVLRVNDGVKGSAVTIMAADAGIDDFIAFTSRGVPKLTNGSTQSGLFRVCEGTSKRGVVLSAAGTVRVTKNAAKIGTCP